MDEVLPEGTLVQVKMEIRVPIAADEDDIDEWLRFSLGANGSCSGGNPLLSHSVETFGPFGFHWEDVGEIGCVEKTLKEEHADGSKRYSVKYLRKKASATVLASKDRP